MCVGHQLVREEPLELFIAVKVVLNPAKVSHFYLPRVGNFFRNTLYNCAKYFRLKLHKEKESDYALPFS